MNVELSLVDETSDHGVVGGVEDLETLKGAVEHDTSAMALLCAPRDFLAFSVGDGVQLLRSP